MWNLNKNNLFPYFAVSLFIHFVFFAAVFYQTESKPVFIQIPFEISFYSPVQDIAQEKAVETVSEKKTEPEKKVNKEDISLNEKKKQEKRKEVKKEIQKPKETEKNDTQKPHSDSVASYASSRGIMIENASFKYSYYTNSIVKKIGRYWQWSSVSSSFRAVVYFKIDREGSVYDVKIKESSGDESFDQNALRAVQLAGPFAPLPEGYLEESLGVYFEFKFR